MPAKVRLRPGESALVGYGSLLCRESLERTYGRPYTGPFLPCEVEGWRRTWDVAIPNRGVFYAETPSGRLVPESILYLNVQAAPGTLLNAVLFVVGEEELAAFDSREWVYDRADVSAQLRGVHLEQGRAYLYTAKPQFVLTGVSSPERAAVRASYVAIVEQGLRELGPAFRAQYLRSTDPLPEHLVISDRRVA